MRSTIVAIILFLISATVFADIIDLECKTKRWGDQYRDFLKKSSNDKSSVINLLKLTSKDLFPSEKKWWQFWIDDNYDDDLFFSIDTMNQKVLYPDDVTIIAISPYLFTIQTYLHCGAPDITKCNGLMFQYVINRVSGKITGDYSAADSSFAPYFKNGDIIYSFDGKCKVIKRKF